MEKHAIWHVKGWSLPYTPFELNFKIKYRDKTLYRQKKPINKIKRRIANWENIANFFFLLIWVKENDWLPPVHPLPGARAWKPGMEPATSQCTEQHSANWGTPARTLTFLSKVQHSYYLKSPYKWRSRSAPYRMQSKRHEWTIHTRINLKPVSL